MSKSKKAPRQPKHGDLRYVWSHVHGGCIMQEKYRYPMDHGEGEWCEWNSMHEGEFPVYDAAASRVVRWYNLQLKLDAAKDRAQRYYQKYLNAQQKVEALRRKQAYAMSGL